MRSIYTLGTSSASHTYGNVISCLRMMIENYLPKNFLKRTYVDSQIAWKDIKEILGNGDREMIKRHYPFLIIQPRLTENDTGRYLYNIPLTKNMDDIQAGVRANTLFPVIRDRQHDVELCYRMNRDMIVFDVELRLKSAIQQIDVFKNLENQMIWDRPYTRQVSLESMIPRQMIAYIGRIAGIDIDASNESVNLVPVMMRYLNSHGMYPITYKVRNSTAVEEFFMYYDTNLMVNFVELNRSDGQKRNSLDEYYSITFRVEVDFNLPGLYAIVGDDKKQWAGMRFDAIVKSEGDSIPGAQMIPMYTFTNLYRNFKMETEDGFQFYSSTIVMIDKEHAGEDDIISLDDVIPYDHMKVLREYLHGGIDPRTLFRFRVLADNRELPCNCRQTDLPECCWEIQWGQKKLVIHCGDPNVTYRIVIYANVIQLNEKLKGYQDAEKRDLPELKKN